MEEYLLEEFEHKGYNIKFYRDIAPENPREWDNLGTAVCFHGRCNLGDKHNFTPESIQYYVKRPDVVALPLFLYDHAGISISTKSFVGRAHHAEWDSGQVGFIVAANSKIRAESARQRVSKKRREQALRILEGEVKVYNQYLQGDVYGYQVEDLDGEEVDSCWGPELKRFVDREVADIEEANALIHQEETGI